MPLLYVSTNYIQSLGRVDQSIREDFEIFIRGQEEYCKNGEYTYSNWRKIVVVFKNLLLNLVLLLFYDFSMEHIWILPYDQYVKPM